MKLGQALRRRLITPAAPIRPLPSRKDEEGSGVGTSDPDAILEGGVGIVKASNPTRARCLLGAQGSAGVSGEGAGNINADGVLVGAVTDKEIGLVWVAAAVVGLKVRVDEGEGGGSEGVVDIGGDVGSRGRVDDNGPGGGVGESFEGYVGQLEGLECVGVGKSKRRRICG